MIVCSQQMMTAFWRMTTDDSAGMFLKLGFILSTTVEKKKMQDEGLQNIIHTITKGFSSE